MTLVDRASVVVALVCLWVSVGATLRVVLRRGPAERRALWLSLTALALTVTVDRSYERIGAATGVANLGLLLVLGSALVAVHLMLRFLCAVHDGPVRVSRVIPSRPAAVVAATGLVVLWLLGPARVPDAYVNVHVVSAAPAFVALYLWVGAWGVACCWRVVRLGWALRRACAGTAPGWAVTLLAAGAAVVGVRVLAEYVVLGAWTGLVGVEASRPLYEPVSDLSTVAMYACALVAAGPLVPVLARRAGALRRWASARVALRDLSGLRADLHAVVAPTAHEASPRSGGRVDRAEERLYRTVIDIFDAWLLLRPGDEGQGGSTWGRAVTGTEDDPDRAARADAVRLASALSRRGAVRRGGVDLAPYGFDAADLDAEVEHLRRVARHWRHVRPAVVGPPGAGRPAAGPPAAGPHAGGPARGSGRRGLRRLGPVA